MSYRKPYSSLPERDLQKLDPRDRQRKSVYNFSIGDYEDVTYYADGSSTRHCGGPCGPMNYDANGEEC